MTHRVHTILSILAEDHAPAALRPSILLAIDWPTVAEEAPATGDDSGIACAASGILSGIGGRENLPALTLATLPLLAARLATVAASLTTTGDKAMAAHADALWGAAAALVGMPTEVREVPLAAPLRDILGLSPLASGGDIKDTVRALKASVDALAIKAAYIVPGVIATGPAEKATLIATALDCVTYWRAMVQVRDTALGALGWDGAENLQAWTAHQKATLENIREALGACTGETAMGAAVRVAEGYKSFKSAHAELCVKFRDEGALVNTQIINERDAAIKEVHAARVTLANVKSLLSKAERDRDNLRAENTRLRAQVDRMSAAMREDAPAPVKPRPQPGDVVPWAEVEDGCLYYRDPPNGFAFRMVTRGVGLVMRDADDGDISMLLAGARRGIPMEDIPNCEEYVKHGILVARNLGADPEAWRAAMREWTEAGNKPPSESSRPR